MSDGLFPDPKERGNSMVVEEFKFVWENLVQISRAFRVQQQYVIEFLVPMGQKWKSFRLVGRHLQRPQESIVRWSGPGSQSLGVRLARGWVAACHSQKMEGQKARRSSNTKEARCQ
jgi:hypothetical protein